MYRFIHIFALITFQTNVQSNNSHLKISSESSRFLPSLDLNVITRMSSCAFLIMETKKCSTCRKDKIISDFHKGNRVCKECRKPYSKKQWQKRLQSRPKIIINDLPGEFWKEMKGYEMHYKISNLGRIKSANIPHKIKGGIIAVSPEKLVMPTLSEHGYYTLHLYCGYKKYKCTYLHILVAENFIPNPLNLPEVNHKDLNKQNYSLDNLEWCTRVGNMQHAAKNGVLGVSGTKNHNSLITLKMINEMFFLRNEKKWKYKRIAAEFNLHPVTIEGIIHRRTWKHLVQDEDGLWIEPIKNK